MVNSFLDTLGQQFGFGGAASPISSMGGGGGPTPTLQQQQGLSPAQIASMREYIKALSKNVSEPIGTVSPKGAPLAGLAKGAESLITGILAGQTDRAERQGAMNAADTLDAGSDTGTPGQSAPSSYASPGGGAPSASGVADLSAGSGVIPMALAKGAIWNNEADNRGYGTIGPEVPANKYHPKGNALGGFQVMSYDLPERLRDAGLPPMTKEEFLASPEAQHKQFEHEFGNLMNKYGNFNDAASAWHSGRPLAVATAQGATDHYMKTSDYVRKANAWLTGQKGSRGDIDTTAYAPQPPDQSGGSGAQAISNALAGGRQPQTSAMGNPQQVAQAVGGGQSPNGGAIPDYQGMVRHKAAQLLRSGQYGYGPGATHSAIADATALVEGSIKYQPQRVEDEHGNVYMKSPNGSIQMLREGSGKVSGVDDGSGLKQFVLENKHPVTGVMKRTPSDPYGNPVGPSTTIGPGGQVVKSSASPSPQGATGAPPAAQGGAGTGGALGTAPPASPQLPSGPIAPGDAPKSIAKYAAVPNPVEAFHLPPKPDFNATPEERRAYGENIKSIGEAHTDDLKKETERYRKNADSLEKNGQIARTAIPQLKMLLQIMDDPKMYSGFLTKEASTISQIKTLFKLGDGKAGEDKMADLQAFAKKLGSTANLADIDERTGEGAGTAKIPTLNQITQSNYDSTNPKPSNRAVTELHLRQMERYNELADFARQFKRNAGGRLNQNFDQFVADYYKDKPFISDQEGYDKLLSGARNQEQPAAASNPITDAIAAERARRKHLNPPVQVPQSR